MESHQTIVPIIRLGFDLGSKSLGVAIRNRLGMILPLAPYFFPRVEEHHLHHILQSLIDEYHPQELVFGVPYHADGRDSFQTQWVKGVIGRLQLALTIPIHTIDERFTTLEAKERLHQFGLPEKKQKIYLDSISACIILEQYEKQPR